MNKAGSGLATGLACIAAFVLLGKSVGGQQPPSDALPTKAGITAPREVHALLDRVRTSLGGDAALLAIRSIAIEGVRAFESDSLEPESFAYKALFPDKYRLARGQFTFLLNGEMFKREPPGSASTVAMAKRNTVGWFGELCLLVLLRSPSSLPVRADFETPMEQNTRVVTFSGPDDFGRTLEFDVKTGRVRALRQTGTLSGQAGTAQVLRTVIIEEYRRFGGILAPVRMKEQIGDSRATITFESVRFGAGVTASDFEVR